MQDKTYKLYNGEVSIDYKDKSHSYWMDSDELTKAGKPKRKRLTGVTTYLGIIDKSTPLLYWQAGIITNFIKNNLSELEKSPNEILALAKEEANRKKDEAADVGSKIHDWIDLYTKGESPEMPQDENVILGVTNFLSWVEDNKVEFLWSERVIYSKKYGYVGTADCGVKINGKKLLGDYKTGNAIYPEVKLQTSAYLMGLVEEIGEEYDGRIVLRISKETKAEHEERMIEKGKKNYPEFVPFEVVYLDEDPEDMDLWKDFEAFKACIMVNNWKKYAEKRMRLLKK